MLYMNADDKILEQDIFVDLNEAEMVGSSDRVNIVAQMDRFRGGFRGDGDWTDTRRYLRDAGQQPGPHWLAGWCRTWARSTWPARSR